MFSNVDPNQGLSQTEINTLDTWGQDVTKRAWTHKKWPERLYHYTTPEGFKGIIETGIVRGTHLAFTNDFQEYKHAVSLGLDAVESLKINAASKELRILNAVNEMFSGTTLFNMHSFGIACFSEHEDKLSQWRAYGLGEGGIAIGFDVQAIVREAHKEGDILGPVIYDLPTKQLMVKESLKWFLSEYPKHEASLLESKRDEHLRNWALNWGWRAAYVGPMFKDHGFREEDEWRLIRRFIWPWEAQYIAKMTHLCPYLEMSFGMARQHPAHWGANDRRRSRPMPPKLPITELWFGPGRYQEHAHASCKFFLEMYDYDKVQLHTSKIPFRSMA